jgi:lipoprotein-releasing system permease protein
MGNNQIPGRDIFKVCGIYNAMGDTPITIALADIRNVQKLNGWASDTFSGFEIDVADELSVEQVAEQLNWNIFEHFEGTENLSAVAASELYANIFAWLQTHDINAVVIIIIMFIVALFNMVTALLILLFERTRMVGILKSLGMDNRSVRKIFLYQAARIVGKGVVIGNCVAIALIILQKYTGVIKLDASAYFVSAVPVNIGVVEILIINTIFAAAILSLLFVATAIVARIEPAESVKYE